ncbi:MAG: hypothetical protein ACYC5W_10385 [Thauera sp.]
MTKVALRKSGQLRAQKQHRAVSPATAETPAPSAAAARAIVRRKEHFQAYQRDSAITVDELASRLLLSPGRIQDLLSGHAPITNELATHIEEMLQLPASWLDEGGPLQHAPSPPTDAVDHLMSISTEVQPFPVADKKQVNDNRRANLTMLTAERGSKNRLAQLAGTSGSRISLMTSARKPVSEPFACAIEDGLGLPRGWLDQPRTMASVPATVWHRLRSGSAALALAHAGHRSMPMPEGQGHEAAASRSADGPTTPAVIAALPVTPSKAASAKVLSATGLFDKQAGQCGPIAEALAKTILNLSAADKLSEARAFQLLGTLIAEGDPAA